MLTCDGAGERATATIGRGRAAWPGEAGNSIELLEEIRFAHWLELRYSAFTTFLGFWVSSGVYGVMARGAIWRAALSRQGVAAQLGRRIGRLGLDLDYFDTHHLTSRTFSDRFLALFGAKDPCGPMEPELAPVMLALGLPVALVVERPWMEGVGGNIAQLVHACGIVSGLQTARELHGQGRLDEVSSLVKEAADDNRPAVCPR